MQWDPVQEKILNDTILGSHIPTDKAKEAVETYIRNCVWRMRKYEPVVMVNFGLFYFDPRKVNRLLRRLIAAFKEKKKITREELQVGLDKYLPLYQIAKTHKPGVGKKYKAKIRFLERLNQKKNAVRSKNSISENV